MASELKALTDEQLVHHALDTERALVTARFRLSMGQQENTNELRVHRRAIARTLTEIRGRENEQSLPKRTLWSRYAKTHGGDAPSQDTEAGPEKGGFLSGIVDKLTGDS